MIIEPDMWYKVRTALQDYLNETFDSTKPEILDAILNDRVLDILHNIDKHIDGIAEKTYKSYRSSVKKILRYIAENIDKTVELVNNPPDWAKKEIVNYFVYRIIGFYPDHTIDYLKLKDFMKYLPIITHVTYNNESDRYAVIYPSDEELNNIELEYETLRDIEDAIEYVISRKLEINIRNRKVKLYDFEATLPISGIIHIADKLKLQSDNLYFEEVKRYLSESLNGAEIKAVNENVITLDLKSMIEEIRNKYKIDIEELYADVNIGYFRPSGSVEFHGVVKIDDKSYKFRVKGIDVGKFEYTFNLRSSVERVFNFTDIFKLHTIFGNYVEKLAEFLKLVEQQYSLFKSSAVKHGFTVYIPNDNLTQIKAYKRGKYTETEIIYPISLTDDPILYNDNIEIECKVKVELGKKLDSYQVSIISEKIGKTVERTKTGIVVKHYIGLHKDIDYDETFDATDTLISRVEGLYERELKNMKRVLPTEETYIALFLASYRFPNLVHYNKDKIESKIREIAKKYNIQTNVDRSVLYSSIGYNLYEKDYISIDNNLNLYINGKRFRDLISPFVREGSDVIERWIVIDILRVYITANELTKGKSLIEALYEKGITSDDTISHILFDVSEKLDPVSFTKPYNGRPVWSYLGEKSKRAYIDRTSIRNLVKIYTTPELREVFSDFIDKIEEQLLLLGIPSIATKIAVEKYRDKLNIPKDAEIVNQGEFYGIKIGNYTVQVFKISKYESMFIVYNQKKEGFLLSAKTIDEAIETYIAKYERLRKMIRTIEELSESTEPKKLGVTLVKESIEGYTYYYIKEYFGKSPINEDTLAELKNAILRSKEYEETVNV